MDAQTAQLRILITDKFKRKMGKNIWSRRSTAVLFNELHWTTKVIVLASPNYYYEFALS